LTSESSLHIRVISSQPFPFPRKGRLRDAPARAAGGPAGSAYPSRRSIYPSHLFAAFQWARFSVSVSESILFSVSESFLFSVSESILFSVSESFLFSVSESILFSVSESILFSVSESFHFQRKAAPSLALSPSARGRI
jgi:hypothetical protein